MPTITRKNLGAWLVRCNPKIWDIETYIDDGHVMMDDWSVVRNYRSRLMEPGDLILLWVTGDHAVYKRGLWGLGHVTGYPEDIVPIDVYEPSDSYYLDDASRRRLTHIVGVDIPIWIEDPLTDIELRASGIDDLEVQVQPHGSNPSWVTIDQLKKLKSLIGGIPDYVENDHILVASSTQVYSADPEQNRYVEFAAMDAVSRLYEARGWDVDDVSQDRVGWDLICARQNQVRRVEVKGISGDRPIVWLTANEIRAAQSQDGWCLAIVVRALTKPEVSEYSAVQAIEAAEPYVYRASLT